MTRQELILLHPPSVFRFRELPIFPGPISDVVPSSSIFEIYPIGFLSLSEYLHRHGVSVRIVNLALKMLRRPSFSPEKFIAGLQPRAFGIDLHWLAHADGSLSLAELVKQYHPETPVILGGLSATYYYEEIMRDYGSVDFVVRGDSAEEPLRQLMESIRLGGGYEAVPNLVWRDPSGAVRVNEMSHRPTSLDFIDFNYGHLLKMAVKYRDPSGYLPFQYWLRYPVTAVFSCRGCGHGCASCGGSRPAFKRVCGREGPVYRSPERLAEDVRNTAAYTGAPIIVIGDLLQAGEAYAGRFLDAMKEAPVSNELALEFFHPPSEKLIQRVVRSVGPFNVEISPESHDPAIRKFFGKDYDNQTLEKAIAELLAGGCRRLDLFFMVGLPHQDYASVMQTVDYCGMLLERYGRDGRLLPMLAPLAPFIDPGSPIFEAPARYGYRLLFRSLREHREALLAPSWKGSLNYETAWMSRDDIVRATYHGALKLLALKEKFGVVERARAARIRGRILWSMHLIKKINRLNGLDDALRDDIRRLFNHCTICDKRELEWPMAVGRVRPGGLLKGLLSAPG
jgi:B12-binding domain/radical SAM domain protein